MESRPQAGARKLTGIGGSLRLGIAYGLGLPGRLWATRLATLRAGLFLEIGQVWVAATLANLLLYLFQLIVGRSLGPEDYSLFGALFGIVYLGGALFNAVQISVAGSVATSQEKVDGVNTRLLVTTWMFYMLVLGGSLLAIFSLASPFIGSYLHASSVAPVLASGALVFLYLLMAVAQGAVQGAQIFALFSTILLIHAGSRLLFGLAALGMSLGVTGVLTAIGLSSILTTAVGLAKVRPSLTAVPKGLPLGGFTRALLPALAVSVMIAIPTSADVIVVRHFFLPEEAGLYAGAAILGRIILFLPLAVSVVLFPKMVRERALGNSSRRLLRQGLGATALMSGVVTAAFALFPELALTVFLGSDYAGARGLVPLYAVAMFFFSLTVVLLYYHLAMGQRAFFYALILPHIVLLLALFYLWHGSLIQVVLDLLGTNISLLVLSQVLTRFIRVKAVGKHEAVQDWHQRISERLPMGSGG